MLASKTRQKRKLVSEKNLGDDSIGKTAEFLFIRGILLASAKIPYSVFGTGNGPSRIDDGIFGRDSAANKKTWAGWLA